MTTTIKYLDPNEPLTLYTEEGSGFEARLYIDFETQRLFCLTYESDSTPVQEWEGRWFGLKIPDLRPEGANQLMEIINDKLNIRAISEAIAGIEDRHARLSALAPFEAPFDGELTRIEEYVHEFMYLNDWACLYERDADEWFDGRKPAELAAEFGITAATTDSELAAIATKATDAAQGDTECDLLLGVERYFKELRDQLGESV
jgi:hypothetical protein